MLVYLAGGLRFGSSEVLQGSSSRRRGLYLLLSSSLWRLTLFPFDFSMYFDIQPQGS